MVVLRKLRATTLVESLVASVIVVTVFMIASMSLNNIFKGSILNDDSDLQKRIKQITYLYRNDKIEIPFYETNKFWEISLEKNNDELILLVENKVKSEKSSLIIEFVK